MLILFSTFDLRMTEERSKRRSKLLPLVLILNCLEKPLLVRSRFAFLIIGMWKF